MFSASIWDETRERGEGCCAFLLARAARTRSLLLGVATKAA